MARRLRVGLIGFVLCGHLAYAIPVSADVVTDWNAIAMARISMATPARGPAGLLDVAMVQAAIHDSLQAFEKKFSAYAVTIDGATGSPIAAAATAAHDVLVARFSAQADAIGDIYEQYLSDRGLATDNPGVWVGRRAADAILALRASDGSFPANVPPVTGGPAPGQWRPTPPGNLAMFAPWAGDVTPFAIGNPANFQPDPLPALTSAEYTEAYNEVKAFGSASGSARNPRQSHLVRFYNDSFPALLYRTLRGIADGRLSSTGERGRLLALASFAAADAFICAWDAKLASNFWRPITAIREGHRDGNSMTAVDSLWTPAITTPNYPEYTSGANNVTAAITRTLALVLGSDKMSFAVTSLSPTLLPTDATTLTYERFSDMAKEVVEVRIWQGVHFRFGDTEARSQGRRIANYAFKNFLQPID